MRVIIRRAAISTERSTEIHSIPPAWKGLDRTCRKIVENTPSTGLSYSGLARATETKTVDTIRTHVNALVKGGIAQIEPRSHEKIVKIRHGATLDVDAYRLGHRVEKRESTLSLKLARASVLATVKEIREELVITPILPLDVRTKGIREALMKLDLEIETNLQFVPPELRPQTLLKEDVLHDPDVDLLLRKLEIYLESSPT